MWPTSYYSASYWAGSYWPPPGVPLRAIVEIVTVMQNRVRQVYADFPKMAAQATENVDVAAGTQDSEIWP